MDDLEFVLQKKVKPLIESVTKKAMGVSIAELNKSLLDTLDKPFLDFEVHDDLPYKQAKALFRKQFISKLIQTHFGNISDVADKIGLDRRSIHREINTLKIDVKRLRQELLQPKHYERLIAENRFKETLDQYKEVIREEKLMHLYDYVHNLSDDVLNEIKPAQMTLSDAEDIWEHRYFEKALLAHKTVAATAKALGLAKETVQRKMKGKK